jgi:hypothetical protein
MAGLAAASSTWVITPTRNGRLLLIVTGVFVNQTGAVAVGDGMAAWLRVGTGTPPAAGAAVVGTVVSIRASHVAGYAASSVQPQIPFTLSGTVAMTVGTAYWVDLSIQGNTASAWAAQPVLLTYTEQ